MCIFFDILRFLVENKIKQKNQDGRFGPLGTGVMDERNNPSWLMRPIYSIAICYRVF
jgi:hypothetical protein